MAKSSKQKKKRKDSSQENYKPNATLKEQEGPVSNKVYHDELKRLQVELVKLLEWIKRDGLKVCVIFERRDVRAYGH